MSRERFDTSFIDEPRLYPPPSAKNQTRTRNKREKETDQFLFLFAGSWGAAQFEESPTLPTKAKKLHTRRSHAFKIDESSLKSGEHHIFGSVRGRQVLENAIHRRVQIDRMRE